MIMLNTNNARPVKDHGINYFLLPGDLALAFDEKLTNQKHSNAQVCPDMFCNDFVILD